ncbi:uncharacterized protein VP01_6236g2 [Puccinia sorghi]|uniref:DUF8040 domain-containing protein n=1 Tax=Puccinia sorghi TaxID=27349 RepID=A0A0L6UHC5_9BASI|nr:uncharacterized protein VP01_6236g2 [Puccinia sorghi]
MAAIVLVTLLLPLAVHSQTRRIPYNNLDLTGANYKIVILRVQPFKLLCTELIQVKMEPVSKLLSMEEQLAIFLHITGHNNSNRLAQDRFQHSGQTISKYFSVTYSTFWFIFLESLYQALPLIAGRLVILLRS